MGTSMYISRTNPGNGGAGGSGGAQQLVEKTATVTIGGTDTLYIPIDVGFDKYEIRTIYVTNDTNNKAVSRIYDKEVGGNKVYQSLEEIYTYDIINVPCEDKDGSKVCHLFIENKGGGAATFTIIMKFTNLL